MDWKTPARPAPQQVPIVLGGIVPEAKVNKPVGQWNRAVITVDGAKTKISVNDQPAFAGPDLQGNETPIILLHRAEGIQFANLYVRPLREPGSPAR